jgi:hypothetical protein
MAAAWLALNESNRKLRQLSYERYAVDMAAKAWLLNGSSIVFDWNGKLKDGQHRLMACVLANESFVTVVVRNVDPDSAVGLDVGVRRVLKDILHWKGEKDTHNLAAVMTMSWRWQHDENFVLQRRFPTHQQSLDWLDHNPAVREAVRRAEGVRRSIKAPTSAVGSFIHQICQISGEQEDAAVFLGQLQDGIALNEGDPVLALRSWMINQQMYHKPHPTFHLAIMIKAWNAWVTGASVKVLMWKRGGAQRESFPGLLDLHGQPFPIQDEKP